MVQLKNGVFSIFQQLNGINIALNGYVTIATSLRYSMKLLYIICIVSITLYVVVRALIFVLNLV